MGSLGLVNIYGNMKIGTKLGSVEINNEMIRRE